MTSAPTSSFAASIVSNSGNLPPHRLSTTLIGDTPCCENAGSRSARPRSAAASWRDTSVGGRRRIVSALEGGLRRQGGELEQAVEYSMADFTVAASMTGLDRQAVLRALGAAQPVQRPDAPADPVVAAIVELRSGDLVRIGAALRNLPRARNPDALQLS